jgi:predicted secreted protein
VLASIIAVAGEGSAGEAPDPMNRVSFQVESSREVANDRIQAVVGITDEDADSARLADRINQTMSRAMATARAASEVRVKSGGYTTHPVHENGKLRRWRASQDLVLESADVDAVTKLVGALQADLQLRSVQFSISPERRRATEDELIAEALKLFQARAEIIRANLGAKHYEIVHIAINGNRGSPIRPVHMEARSMAAMAPAPPAFEGGSSRLSVFIDGTIEFD